MINKIKKGKTGKYILILIVALIILVPIIRRKMAIAKEPPPVKYDMIMKVAKAKKGKLNEKEAFLGFFKAKNKMTVATRVSARVVFIAEEGRKVNKGNVILRLDSSGFAASSSAAKTRMVNQERQYKRDKVLFDNKAISQRQFEQSENLYKQAVAASKNASDQLGYAVIKAPFDGIVGKRHLNAGDMVFPGRAVLELDGTEGGYEIYADIPMETAAKIKPGSKHEIVYQGKKMKITAKAVVPSAKNNNLMAVKFEAKDNPLNIPPRTNVDLNVYTARGNGIIASKNSVMNNMKGYFALEIVSGKAHWKKVKVLSEDENDYCVKGIEEGILLGILPVQDLMKIHEGEKVKIFEGK